MPYLTVKELVPGRKESLHVTKARNQSRLTRARIPWFVGLVGVVGLATLLGFDQATPDPWLILADGTTGPINAHTTLNDLVRQYGAKNVVEKDVDIGEGETEPGVTVFPDDPTQAIEILWKNPKEKNSPKMVTIHGPKSRWKAVHGITLGTTLKELEALNGRPFKLAGFSWDYSGTVYSWEGGLLEKEKPFLLLRLAPPKGASAPRELDGDREFSSNHALMQKVNPRVYAIVWRFSE